MTKVWPTREQRVATPYKLRFSGNDCDGRMFTVRWYSQTIGQFEDHSTKAFWNSDIYAFKSNSILKRELNLRVKADKWADYHFESTFKAPRVKEGRGRPKKQKSEEINPDQE